MTSQTETADYALYDLGAVYPKLRADVTLRSDRFGGEDCVVIEDSVRSQFFRLGPAEAVFVSLLDGKTSVSDAVAETASVVEGSPLTETEAGAFCRWLVENGLASTPQSLSDERLLASAAEETRRKRSERLNPVMVKTPFGCPDPIMSRLAGAFGWMFGPLGLVTSSIVVVWALLVAWTRADEIAATVTTLGLHDVPIFVLTAGLLKLVHEAGHGIACRRLGCEVRECGVLWLLFIPLPYVDVTASWRLGSKWDRVQVAAAGMLTEFFIAALAILVWNEVGSPAVRHHALNVAMTAGVITLLFNANPLMRFDGYYILSDLLELPNLASHGQLALRTTTRRLLFGQKGQTPTWPEGRSWLVRGYGVAAFLWRVLICVSLTLAAESLYYGAGVVLAAAAAAAWVLLPTGRFLKNLVRPDPVDPVNRLHFACVALVLAAVVYGGLNHIYWTQRFQLPAVVEHTPITQVRTSTAGFIEIVHVTPGQAVRRGDPLLTLRNQPLIAEVRQTEIAIEQSLLDETGFHRRRELAAAAVERENTAALRVRLSDLRDRLAKMTVRAPVEGRVLTPRPDELVGRWATAGRPLLELSPTEGPAVHFYVPQQAAQSIQSIEGRDVRLRLWGGHQPVQAQVADVTPRAARKIETPQLTAAAGGPLAVMPDEKATEGWQLVEPHFIGRLRVPGSRLDHIGVGQTGVVELAAERRTIGELLASELTSRWQQRVSRR